jgi:hypothetical protein
MIGRDRRAGELLRCPAKFEPAMDLTFDPMKRVGSTAIGVMGWWDNDSRRAIGLASSNLVIPQRQHRFELDLGTQKVVGDPHWLTQ